MLTPANFKGYQRKATLHQMYYPHSMLWLFCGGGKTIVTLTTIEHRMRTKQVTKTLIFGPLRIIHSVWGNEAKKWSHTKHLRFSVIHGTPKERLRKLFTEADIYLCNYEQMAWLSDVLTHYYIKQGKPLPFEMVVYDEVTRVKNSNSQRVGGGWKYTNKGKANEERKRILGWRKMIPHFKYATGLTGTPSANGYIDLHGQYLVVDGGKRLGEYVTHFKNSYFSQGYDGWTYTVTEPGKQWIEHKIADITIKMDAEDYLTLPPLTINDIFVDLPEPVMKQYREVEKEMFTRLDDGTEIELFNRASVSNKTLQFCNGSPYKKPGEPEWVDLHDEKLQALDSILEEAAGKTVLVGYSFKADAARIMKRYKKLKPVNLTMTPVKKLRDVIDKGCKGQIKLMIGHPASLGHGVDGLNEFCNIIVWFGLNWSLELYEQLIGRIASGERFKKPVTMHRILCRDTIDLAVADALRRKNSDQIGLKNAIQRYRSGMTPRNGELSFM